MPPHLRTRFAVLAAILLLSMPGASGQQQQPALFTPAGSIPVLESYLEALRQQSGIPGRSLRSARPLLSTL